jgi:hypothetical protein
MVTVPGVAPQAVEPWVREVSLRSEGYVSLDGRWTALLSQHIYGPQDILIITPIP